MAKPIKIIIINNSRNTELLTYILVAIIGMNQKYLIATDV
jgi:hypothetical protein